jgi:hypothetical protein
MQSTQPYVPARYLLLRERYYMPPYLIIHNVAQVYEGVMRLRTLALHAVLFVSVISRSFDHLPPNWS